MVSGRSGGRGRSGPFNSAGHFVIAHGGAIECVSQPGDTTILFISAGSGIVSMRWVLDKALSDAGWRTTVFDNAGDVLRQVQSENPDVIITDIRMPGTDGLELLQYLNERTPSLPVIVMTAHTDLENALSAYQAGAFEYLPKPFDLNEAVGLLHRALEKHSQTPPAPTLQAEMTESSIIGEAKAMQAVFRVIGRLSKSTINVLICGETGTGKELVAGAIHHNSPTAQWSVCRNQHCGYSR